MGLVDKAKEAAKRGVDAGKKGANEAREKAHELSLKRRLSALAEDLGQVVFRQREGETGLDAEVDRLVSEMRAVNAEIEALAED
jgi:polyhydroxyalkanoate synthesis regulator phasin